MPRPVRSTKLDLNKQVILGDDTTEIKMILTTPFCPYAGSMIQQVKEAAEEADGDVFFGERGGDVGVAEQGGEVLAAHVEDAE